MAMLELNQDELYDLHIALSSVDNESYTTIKNKINKAMGFPVELEYDKGYDNIARLLMQAIQYENDLCNRWEREKYIPKWVELIKEASTVFFSNNPQYINEKDIERIANGEECENEEEFGNLVGWSELNRVLNHYFDHYPEEDEPQGD